METRAKKRKMKQYFNPASKKHKKKLVLTSGFKGFLLTCNNREREAVHEAYNILNEHADQLFGTEQECDEAMLGNAEVTEDTEEGNASDEDISAELEKEIAGMSKEPQERRFQVVESGANNCVFIKTKLGRPDLLQFDIMSQLQESQQSKSRFILRMIPVIETCRADGGKLDSMVSDIFPLYFGTGKKLTYAILTKIRNNTNFQKSQVRPIIIRRITELNPMHTLNSHMPDIVVEVNVIKNVICLSVMKKFYEFRKYNMQEAWKPCRLNANNKQTSEADTSDHREVKQTSVKADTSKMETVTDKSSITKKSPSVDEFTLFGSEDKDYRRLADAGTSGAGLVSHDVDYRKPAQLPGGMPARDPFGLNETDYSVQPDNTKSMVTSGLDTDYRRPTVVHSQKKSIASAVMALAGSKLTGFGTKTTINKPFVPDADATGDDTLGKEDKDYRILPKASTEMKTSSVSDSSDSERLPGSKEPCTPTGNSTESDTQPAVLSTTTVTDECKIPVIGHNIETVQNIDTKDIKEESVAEMSEPGKAASKDVEQKDETVYTIPVLGGRSVVKKAVPLKVTDTKPVLETPGRSDDKSTVLGKPNTPEDQST